MAKRSPRHAAIGIARSNGGAANRCAVYTRKSSEEGLEQAFNSLDAQREACEAYVLSQKHEGWRVLPEMYDDGGVSGATMERPALQRLLADIRARRIDTVVVYKVDRLTRALSDFAKIVEVFDGHGVAFVSVTQAFNTTTSMGRLTLNMLLSFAQFEREVTSERIRDKIAASKQKGLWMGGLPPLGYDVSDRKLVVNAAEAETVRHVFRRYADLGSVRELQHELDAAGIVSKRRLDRFGRETGGKPIARGAIYLMLQNRIYRGEIVHKDMGYPGAHDAIIDEGLWDKAQKTLAQNRVERRTGVGASQPSLLAGLLYDDDGERMIPTHANKKGTRYRYYVSQSLIKRGRPKGVERGRRVPAADIESLVEERIIAFFGDAEAIYGATEPLIVDPAARAALATDAAGLAKHWSTLPVTTRRGLLQQLAIRITLGREAIEIAVELAAIAGIVGNKTQSHDTASEPSLDDQRTITLSVPARLRRAGMEMRLLIDGPGGGPRRDPDRSLLRLLARAQRFNSLMLEARGRTMRELAEAAGVTPSYFTRVLRLSFLAPDIVRMIMRGQQPPQLTAQQLIGRSDLAPNWLGQAARLGVA